MFADDAYIAGDEEICEACLNTCFARCEVCDEIVRNEDIHYCEETDQYLCDWCLENKE